MRRFLFYILKPDGRSAKVVNGVVTYTGTPTPLPSSPDGWQTQAIAWERNIQDHGIIRNFSLPFGFPLDGLHIIRDALYRQSIEEELLLLIQELTLVLVPGVSYEWLYDYLYRGELDLSAAEDNLDMINVPCMEGGLHKLLKANRATKYTYPFDLDAVTLVHDGISYEQRAHFVLSGVVGHGPFHSTFTMPFGYVDKDGTSVGTAFFDQHVEDVFNISTYVGSSTNYPIDNNSGASITYRLLGSIRYVCTRNDTSAAMRWWIVKNDNTQIDIYTSVTSMVIGAVIDVPIDVTFTLLDGEKCFLIARYFAGFLSTTTIVDFLDSKLDVIEFANAKPPTLIVGYRKSTLFRKLCVSMGIDITKAVSTLCDTWDYIICTSGDAIRGLENPQITTSLNDFFLDMDATFMAGLSIENGFVELEGRAKYYDNSNPIDLGNAKDCVYSPAVDLICNKFKFGHVKPDIEDINGKFDPNGSEDFTGPITKVVKDYTMVSNYKAGPFEIESLRLNLDGKVTTDDNRDTSVYVINSISHRILTADISFFAAGFFLIDNVNGQYLNTGQQIQISGTVSNDGIYNVSGVGSIIFATLVPVSGTLVDEIATGVTLTVLRGEILTLNRPAYTQLLNVPNDTIYNLPQLTPKAMLFAHGRWIRSMNKGLEALKLVFNSGDKNTELLTELAGVTIDEDADEVISGLGAEMFLPFYVTFKTQVPVDIVNILEASPNRCFTLFDEARGVQVTGFLMAAGFAPNDLKEQEYRLLLAPNNDLTLLI